MVHGGRFYQAQKYTVAPDELPDTLHWFKYEAYSTWITGFLLLAVIYYWGAESYLIDRDVLDLTPAEAIGISIAMLAGGWVLYDLICKSPIGQNVAVLAVLVFVLIVGAAYAFGDVFSPRAAYIHAGALVGTILVS